MNWEKFALWERSSLELIVIKKNYFYIIEDLIATILFVQILYWFLPGKNGEIRTSLIRDGERWVAKRRSDWLNECCITEYQYDRAIKILKDKGLIEIRIFKFAGGPRIHITLKQDVFIKLVEEFLDKQEIDKGCWNYED